MTENELVMPVTPMYGGGNGNGFGYGGDFWLILILLFACGGWGGFGGGFAGGQLGYDFPWLLNGQQGVNANTNAGFNQAATASAISALQNSVTSGFGDVQLGIAGVNQNICQTGSGITQAVTNGFAQAEIADNARQIANLQQAFAGQTAMAQGFSGVQSQLAQCCCDNRLATCQTQNIVQNEGNATRFADANNTRDIIQSQTSNTQAILDKLCQLELDAKNDKISDLERQLTMANLQASQTAQNAFIAQGFSDEVDALYNRLNSCPVPSTPVFGRTPIFQCNNNGCGCGGTNF